MGEQNEQFLYKPTQINGEFIEDVLEDLGDIFREDPLDAASPSLEPEADHEGVEDV